MTQPKKPPQREGKLKIDAPFDNAIRAALNVKPPEKTPRKPRSKKKPDSK